MPDVLEPGSNVSVRVALEPNKLNSGTPPPNHPPLLLQVRDEGLFRAHSLNF